jgi:fido (protein-threonine AMPylation protein)
VLVEETRIAAKSRLGEVAASMTLEPLAGELSKRLAAGTQVAKLAELPPAAYLSLESFGVPPAVKAPCTIGVAVSPPDAVDPSPARECCAGIMIVEGFKDVDPQAPIGGRDDRKDLLASKGGLRWVGAVYFPPTTQTFPSIKAKFLEDLDGVSRNRADAFAFLVNQRVTVGQRGELEKSASVPVEVYHLERLRMVLDSPLGYGLRVQYLAIPMNIEEQSAFVLALQQGAHQQAWREPEAELEKLNDRDELVLARTTVVGVAQDQPPSSVGADTTAPSMGASLLSTLSVELLVLIHRLTVRDALVPGQLSSQLRPVNVQIGDTTPSYLPPSPDQVPPLLSEYIAWWRTLYPQLVGADSGRVIQALAALHHRFLLIHPFLDGNGRVARVLLDQAARELLHTPVGPALTVDSAAYFESLRAADRGDTGPLEELIRVSLQSPMR